MNNNNEANTVKVYDFTTKTITVIPKSELAPGMVEGYFQALKEKLWFDPKQAPIHLTLRHPAFDEKRRGQLRKLVKTLKDVNPRSIEEWELAFRCDTNPDIEIAIWMLIAKIHRALCKANRLSEDQRWQLLEILRQCSVSGCDCIREVISPEGLPPAIITRAIQGYYAGQAHVMSAAPKQPVNLNPCGNPPQSIKLLATPEGQKCLKDAKIIFGVDTTNGTSSLLFGTAALKRIIKSGKRKILLTVAFYYDNPDQLAQLIAAVKACKGSCCYRLE